MVSAWRPLMISGDWWMDLLGSFCYCYTRQH